MHDSERKIQATILAALGSRPDIRLFRNAVGHGYHGDARLKHEPDGSLTVVIRKARRVSYGLAPGSCDLIGVRRVLITPDMVGQHIAQFLGIECKSASGRSTVEQKDFRAMLERFGGISILARSLDDVEGL